MPKSAGSWLLSILPKQAFPGVALPNSSHMQALGDPGTQFLEMVFLPKLRTVVSELKAWCSFTEPGGGPQQQLKKWHL